MGKISLEQKKGRNIKLKKLWPLAFKGKRAGRGGARKNLHDHGKKEEVAREGRNIYNSSVEREEIQPKRFLLETHKWKKGLSVDVWGRNQNMGGFGVG